MSTPQRPRTPIRARLPVALAGLACFAAGSILTSAARPGPARADDRPAAHARPDTPDPKGPVREVLHCPLAFAGVHLLKDLPDYAQVAYHYCKPVNADVSQCLLYDGTGPDARLIGVEYLVSDALYRSMPDEEKVYWHDHHFEVDRGLIRSLTQSGDEEKATLATVRTLWGKVFHTWPSGKSYPMGPPRLFWSVTGEPPFVLPADAKLPPEIRGGGAKAPD